MFKSFFKETRWLLLIVMIMLAVLGGNVVYFMNDGSAVSDHYVPPSAPNFEPHGDKPKAEDKEGLKLTQLTETLYSLTGTVRADDCEKIVPKLPKTSPFTIILESPGGVLNEGACLASHLKLRNVVTVVRDTPILDHEGEILYQPGLVPTDQDRKGKVICASACSLMFLGGDIRYLIGDVWFGIHGPRTPEDVIQNVGRQALEASAYRTAASLLMLLERLGVEDPNLRNVFIQIPAQSMYWLNPRDWEATPMFRSIATHYIKFWGVTTENVLATVGK